MTVEVVGVDCATQDAKVGVAFGEFSDGRLSVQEAFACTREASAAVGITQRLQHRAGQALMAIDAPLGWPQTLARVLANHRAGEALEAEAHDMFRRETDLFIKKKTGKTPLDVGADRIARTAYAALRLLRDLKGNLNHQIPLAWEWPLVDELSAIEVYPAATLIGHGSRSGGYKKAEQSAQRTEIIESLRSVAQSFRRKCPAKCFRVRMCLMRLFVWLLQRISFSEKHCPQRIAPWQKLKDGSGRARELPS